MPFTYWAGRELEWLPDGQALIFHGEEARLGAPCAGDFPAVDDPATLLTHLQDPSLSPDSRYRAHSTEIPQEGLPPRVVTTIEDAATGEVLHSIEWQHWGGKGQLGLGGQWLTAGLFLIYGSTDQGPLLVEVGQAVVQVAPDLFGVSLQPESGTFMIARGTAIPGSDGYHIAMAGSGLEAGQAQVYLYHSENDQVEALPFAAIGGPAFSPDGTWLTLEAHPIVDGYESAETWMRPVDPPGSQAIHLADTYAGYLTWAPDWSRVAFPTGEAVQATSLPDATPLGTWSAPNYTLYPSAWAPAGNALLLYGHLPNGQGEALFVVPVP